MESMVIKYRIKMTSIVWRLIASVVFLFSFFQLLSSEFFNLAFYSLGAAWFSFFVLSLLWKGIPCTLVINKEDNDD